MEKLAPLPTGLIHYPPRSLPRPLPRSLPRPRYLPRLNAAAEVAAVAKAEAEANANDVTESATTEDDKTEKNILSEVLNGEVWCNIDGDTLQWMFKNWYKRRGGGGDAPPIHGAPLNGHGGFSLTITGLLLEVAK